MKFFFILATIFASAVVSAQGVYEIKYKFYEKTADGREVLGQEYSTVLFFYDANNPGNVMRTRYYDANQGWQVVEQKVRVQTKFQNGKSMHVMGGVSPRYVTTQKNLTYYPDYIVLSKTSDGNYYQPEYVYDDNNMKGVITGFRALERDQITTSYLSPYKWSWTTTTTTTRNTNVDLSQSTIHLILVTNSTDEKLGDGFMVNQKMMQGLFKNAAQACNMKLNTVEVSGSQFNKPNVVSALDNLSTSPNDIVVFYYSGHGFRLKEQTSNWPRMDLRATVSEDIKVNSMNLDLDVFQPLSKKNPRLLMVIGECCNVYLDWLGTPSIKSPLMMPLGSTVMNESVVKSLFSKKGRVLLATSKPTEYSWYYNDRGGFFGSQFLSAFQKSVGFTNSNTTVTWNDIFKEAIRYTVQRTESREGGTEPQHPIYYFDLK